MAAAGCVRVSGHRLFGYDILLVYRGFIGANFFATATYHLFMPVFSISCCLHLPTGIRERRLTFTHSDFSFHVHHAQTTTTISFSLCLEAD